jgi:hypothetical protein
MPEIRICYIEPSVHDMDTFSYGIAKFCMMVHQLIMFNVRHALSYV